MYDYSASLTADGGDTKGLLATSKLSKLDINRSSTGKDAIRFKLIFNLANFMCVNSVKKFMHNMFKTNSYIDFQDFIAVC